MGNHGSYRRLCRSDRHSLFGIYSLAGMVEDLAVSWGKKKKISEEEVKLYAESLSKLFQAIRLFEEKLEPGVDEQLKKEIYFVKSIIVPSQEGEKLKKQLAEDNTNAFVSQELLDVVTEKALYWCNPCEVKYHSKCELKKAFAELKIEPYNFEHGDNCPYLIKAKFKKGLSSVDEFIKYCGNYEYEPGPELIRRFEALIKNHKDYYESTNVPEKVVRKFLQQLVPSLFKD